MNIAVVYGGDSVEHDVSVLTSLHALKNLSDEISVSLVYITRTGQFLTAGRYGYLSDIDYYLKFGRVRRIRRCWFDGKFLYRRTGMVFRKKRIDAVLNCCHGGMGEDGRLAAYFAVLGIPITSCDMREAHATQSKTRTREILTVSDFAQPKYITIKNGDYGENALPPELIDFVSIYDSVVVKPDKLGSSIGIAVVHDKGKLRDAIEFAFTLDDTVIVEQFIRNATEVNCAVFKYSEQVLTSACEVITKQGSVFDFDTKYLDEGSGFIKKSGKKTPQYEHEDEIKKLATDAYRLMNLRGVVRADFLVADGKIYLNEFNTVPGFLAYHLWQGIGLPYPTLLGMAIEEAIKSTGNDKKTGFESEILQKNRILVE